MPTREELQRGVKAELIVGDRVQDRGQLMRFEQIRLRLEAIMERADHPAAVVAEALASLEILRTCEVAEADDERRHALAAAIFDGSLPGAYALALEIRDHSDDVRTQSLAERLLKTLRTVGGMTDRAPRAALKTHA